MIRLSCAAILCLIASDAKAQFLQYTAPGGPDSRQESTKERLEREISEAPRRLGPVYIAPILGFRDAAYVRNFFASGDENRSDVTATVAAGLRAYLRTGRKMTWIAQVLPEYVWWNKREEARRLNLSYGFEGVALFNRLTIDVAASRAEQQRIVTPEIPELANSGTDLIRLDAELEASPTLFPFVSARWSRQEGLLDERDDPRTEQIELLDHDEQVARAGLRWLPRAGWMIGLGVERSETEFDRAALDSSNEGTAPVLEVRIDRRRFYFNADLAARSLEAREGSRFVGYDGVTGSVSVSFAPRSRSELWVYANRDLAYSLSPDYPYFEDERTGIAVGTGIGDRLFVRTFVEIGANDYTPFSPTASDRQEDLLAYGSSVRFSITPTLALAFQASRIEFDSNLQGGDRSYTSGGLTLTLNGNLVGRNL